jgi:hypothetical protein
MRTTPLFVAIATAIAVPTAARADVRVGLGAAASTDAQGLSADLDLGPAIIEATAFTMSTKEELGGYSQTVGSIGALARLAHDGKVSLYGGVRVDHLWMSQPFPFNGQYIGPEMGVPVRIQIDVTPWLSIDAEDALELFSVGSTHGVELLGPSLGFTVWF